MLDLIGDVVHVASSSQVQTILQMVTALNLAPFDWPRNTPVEDGDSYDYVVVGCGTSGSVIANRLTEIEDLNVLCIDAGGDPVLNSMLPLTLPFLVKSKQDWNYTSTDDHRSSQSVKGKVLEMTSGKMLGGSSSLDHMFNVRANPVDFSSWAEAASDDSWNWDGLYQYYLKAENCLDKEILNSEFKNAHGTSGYLKVKREPDAKTKNYLKSFSEIGNDIVLDLFSNTTLGYTQPLVSIVDGFRQSHAYTYLRSAKDRANLKVLKNSLVTKIIFEGDEAVGVEVLTKGNKRITINARKEVIVTAGALGTPKILMLSGIGPKKHLEPLGINVISDLPVGENLQDHTAVIIIHKMKRSLLPGPATLPSPFKFPGVTMFGSVALNKSQNYPDYTTISAIYGPESVVLFFLCSITIRYEDEICQRLVEANIGRETLYTTLNLLHQKSRGEVLLKTTDPYDRPLIKTGLLSDPNDLEDMVDYIEDFTRVVDTKYFKSVKAELLDFKLPQCKDLEFKSREYWRCYVKCITYTIYQYSSTAPIGTVLDNKLRVRGVKNLRVADASAMPNAVSGTIKITITALAEKGADLIKEDFKLNY